MVNRRLTPASNRPLPGPKTVAANRLLAALPATDYTRLASSLEVVPLALKEFIHRPGEPTTHVYFPGGGFFSELTVLANGDMVEVATVGREGMVGLTAAVEGAIAASATMVQADIRTCFRLAAPVFRREMDRRDAFYQLIARYTHAHTAVVMQSTACNAVHALEQRLARWLLMAHDRIETNPFALTQEFVAMMLGAARPTVTIVAGTLQKAGLITYSRGQVTIVNRPGLEQAACECYGVAVRLLQGLSVTPPLRRASMDPRRGPRRRRPSDAGLQLENDA
jgi:CRP-like cAMP-binding protein